MNSTPTARLLEQAQFAVRDAELALSAAAELGADTVAPRARLTEAQGRLKTIQEASLADAMQAEVDRQERLRVEAEELVAKAQAEIQAAIAGYASLVVPEVPHLHHETAINMVHERQAVVDHAALVQAHDERLAKLKARQADLAARRQAILDRRAQGQEQPEDAAEVNLLTMDAQVLADLARQLEAEAPPRHLDTPWAKRWQSEVDDAKRQAFGAMAGILGERLAGLITEARRGFGRLTVSISPKLQAALAGVGVRV